jgi:hypothetical protein
MRIAVLAAASTPDLGSRTRQALAREGHRDLAMGTATTGRHTAVTLRVPDGTGQMLERIARQLSASLTILDTDASREVDR